MTAQEVTRQPSDQITNQITNQITDQITEQVTVDPVAPAASRPPRSGTLAGLGITLALLTTAAGAACLRDALTHGGILAGRPWLDAAIRGLDGLRPQWWGVAAGAAAVIIGFGLLLASAWPRPRRSLPLASRTGVELSRRAVGQLAVRAAQDIDGVLSVRAHIGRGQRITLSALVTGDPAAAAESIRRVVRERLAGLATPPEIRATARTERDR